MSNVAIRSSKPLPFAALKIYVRLLNDNGLTESGDQVYTFSRLHDVTPINRILREAYLSMSPEERTRFGDPFAAGPGPFPERSLAPDAIRGDLSPLMMTIYGMRPDVAAAFPEVTNRSRFLAWARTDGAREMNYEACLVPDR